MKKNSFFNKIIENYEYKGYFLSVISLIITILFLIYNFYIGLKYTLIWNLSIILYYIVLTFIKATILISEKRLKTLNEEKTHKKRINLFKIQNRFLIIMDLTLVVPITLLVLEKRIVNIGIIPAIAVAAYTTFKIILSIINYHKTKKMNNLSLYSLKIINLKEAIVSIITLQNILIMTFSNGESMIELTSYTSAGMLLSLVGISVYQIIKTRKKFR